MAVLLRNRGACGPFRNPDIEPFVKLYVRGGEVTPRLSRKAARPEGAGCVEESEAGIAVGQDWIPEARVERSTTPWAVGQTASSRFRFFDQSVARTGTDT
jgi:hypothetical protein